MNDCGHVTDNEGYCIDCFMERQKARDEFDEAAITWAKDELSPLRLSSANHQKLAQKIIESANKLKRRVAAHPGAAGGGTDGE